MIGLLWWAKEYPVTAFAEEAEISEHTAVDVYQWLREVCSTRLLQKVVPKYLRYKSSNNVNYVNTEITKINAKKVQRLYNYF